MGGAFVTEEVSYIPPVDAGNYVLITEQINKSNETTDNFIQYFQDAADNITAVESYSPDYSELESTIKELRLPSAPNRPSIPISLQDFPDTEINSPVHQDIKVNFELDEPVAPNGLNPDFEYTPGTYFSKIFPLLQDALLADLANGGTGLTESAYQGIIDRYEEARRQQDDAARLALNRKFGGPGALMPSGAYMSAELELEENIRRGKKDSLNAILVKDFELADANAKFTKELLQSIEEMLRTDFNSSEERLFNIAAGAKEVAIKIYEQNARIYNARWEGEKVKFEAARLNIEALIAANASADENFKTRANVLDTKVKAVAARNKSVTDSAVAKSDIYKNEMQGYAVEANALIEEVRESKDKYLADLKYIIDKEGLNLEAYTSSNALNAEKTVSLAQLMAQAVASSLGMINTGLSMGQSQANSNSHSYHLGSSLSETHSYSEE